MAPTITVYLVSDEKGSRYTRAMQRIIGLGFKVIHIPAVFVTSSCHRCYDSKGRVFRRGHDLKPGEIGCFLAHKKAWEHIANQDNESVALVVEDDVDFKKKAQSVLLEAAKLLKPCEFIRAYSDYDRRLLKVRDLGNGIQMGVPTAPGNTTVAYMLRAAGAQKLIKNSLTFNRPVDDYLGHTWLHGLRELALSPSPCIHDHGGQSVIGQRTKSLGFRPFICRLIESLLKRYIFIKSVIK